MHITGKFPPTLLHSEGKEDLCLFSRGYLDSELCLPCSPDSKTRQGSREEMSLVEGKGDEGRVASEPLRVCHVRCRSSSGSFWG